MLDPTKSKELMADIAALEVGPLNPQTYEKLMVLKAVKFFDELDEHGGVNSLFAAQDRPEATQAPSVRQTPTEVQTAATSDFLAAVDGKDTAAVMNVIDAHMATLQQINERAYNLIMRRLAEI